MTLAETFPPMRERDVKLDDEMPVAWLVYGPGGAVAPLDDSGECQRGELALRVALLDPGPDGGSLRGVLAEGKRVEETKPAGIGDPLERGRGALVFFVARALEHLGVAREEV